MALAGAVSKLLQRNEEYLVLDKESKKPRHLKAKDIAILCRTNVRAMERSIALSKAGIPVSIPQAGLLKRAEGALALAAFRCMADPMDSLAMAEVVHIVQGGNRDWFETAVNNSNHENLKEDSLVKALSDQRSKLIHLTPLEALDLAIFTVGLERLTAGWGDSQQRLTNLGALRGFAMEYEDRCKATVQACSHLGFIAYLQKLAADEQDVQPVPSSKNAVNVLTYHKAKGLEWPVVVLLDLDSGSKAQAFGVNREGTNQGIDPQDPLKDRWIRFWPWPYGNHSRDFGFDGELENSDVLAKARQRERNERIRLLYVAMTRARDYLFLGVRPGKKNFTAWLDELKNVNGDSLLSMDAAESGQFKIGSQKFPVSLEEFSPADEAEKESFKDEYVLPLPDKIIEYPPAVIIP
ncbi:MAG: 3'-5' exonuclease, partial [Desulfonatronovibrio sp.]